MEAKGSPVSAREGGERHRTEGTEETEERRGIRGGFSVAAVNGERERSAIDVWVV